MSDPFVPSSDPPEERPVPKSPTMAKFFRSVARIRAALAEIGRYFMHWDPVGILIGLLVAGGGFALAVAVIPEKISPALYTIAEILFVIGIALFVAKCIYDFRGHTERRLVWGVFTTIGCLSLIIVVTLFESNRPRAGAQTVQSAPSVGPHPDADLYSQFLNYPSEFKIEPRTFMFYPPGEDVVRIQARLVFEPDAAVVGHKQVIAYVPATRETNRACMNVVETSERWEERIEQLEEHNTELDQAQRYMKRSHVIIFHEGPIYRELKERLEKEGHKLYGPTTEVLQP